VYSCCLLIKRPVLHQHYGSIFKIRTRERLKILPFLLLYVSCHVRPLSFHFAGEELCGDLTWSFRFTLQR
jgi:hypothetical protein